MISQNSISTYLMPATSSGFARRRRWLILKGQLTSPSARHVGVLRRTLLAGGVWGLMSLSYSYATTPHILSPHEAFSSSLSDATSANTLTSVQRVSELTSGPTGTLLPPGTMAPDATFPNHYARGQCTWYVAGRRQIPPNWGNANSWYYHAIASGWHVGTTPAIAAVAWTPAGAYGHVALVEQISLDSKSVYISEMNYRAIGVKTSRWVSAGDFKYIY
jgi:surface antigen